VGNDKTTDEGTATQLNGSYNDPGTGDTHTWAWAYTDGLPHPAACSFSDQTLMPKITCADDGEVIVTLTVRDHDAGEGSDALTLTVNNVAPTATALTTNSPVAEGSNITLALAGPTDVSSVDRASLHFAFDCGSGYGAATNYAAAGTANAASCPTTDNGIRAVKGKVFDKDGGSNEYTANATITNVNPMITSLTAPDGSALATSLIVAGTLPIKVNFTDPGTGDTHKAQIDCDNGSGTVNVNGGANVTTGFQTSCTYPSVGADKIITVTVTDDDGGPGSKTHKLTVTYNFAGFFAPVDRPNVMNLSKAGQAIPLKWRLTDALNRPITDLTGVTVKSVAMSCDNGSVSDPIEEYATASTSGLLNLGDGNYQYNWKTATSLAGTCKSVSLVFGTGGLSYTEGPRAYFTFKK